MEQETREQDTDFVEPEGTVTLVAPDGAEYRTHDAVTINNLVYGQGYAIKGDEADDDEADSAGAADVSSPGDTDPARTGASTTPDANSEASATTEASQAPTPSPTTVGKSAAKASGSKAASTATPPSTT